MPRSATPRVASSPSMTVPMLQRVGTSWSQPLVTISMDEELLGAPPEGLEPKGPDHGDVLDPPRLCAVRSKDLSSATALTHSRGRQRPQGLRLTCQERVERADERGAQRWRESRPGRRTWRTTFAEHVLKTHDPKCNSAFPRRRPRCADLLYPGISPYLRLCEIATARSRCRGLVGRRTRRSVYGRSSIRTRDPRGTKAPGKQVVQGHRRACLLG